MDPALTQRILETYHQAQTAFGRVFDEAGVRTPLGVRRIQLERVGEREGRDSVLHQLSVHAAPPDSAHGRMAMAAWRARFEATILQEISPFLETLAEALPVAHQPHGGIHLTAKEYGGFRVASAIRDIFVEEGLLEPSDEPEPVQRRLLLRVNGLTLENGPKDDPTTMGWESILRFVQAVHHLPPAEGERFTAPNCPSVAAASMDDARVLWRAAGYTPPTYA